MSRGRKLRAGNRILDRRNQHAQPHLQLARHDHVRERQRGRGAAHVLLHVEHAASGLMSRPPVSKHTPLPTSVTLRMAWRRPR